MVHLGLVKVRLCFNSLEAWSLSTLILIQSRHGGQFWAILKCSIVLLSHFRCICCSRRNWIRRIWFSRICQRRVVGGRDSVLSTKLQFQLHLTVWQRSAVVCSAKRLRALVAWQKNIPSFDITFETGVRTLMTLALSNLQNVLPKKWRSLVEFCSVVCAKTAALIAQKCQQCGINERWN